MNGLAAVDYKRMARGLPRNLACNLRRAVQPLPRTQHPDKASARQLAGRTAER
jgi:hypothetical protein